MKMSTNNFINHENGIFLITQYSWEEAKNIVTEYLKEDGVDREPSDDEIETELDYLNYECALDDFENNFYTLLYENRYRIKKIDEYNYNIYTPKKSECQRDKLVANVYLKSGYYNGTQVIVETDPNKLFDMGYFDTKAELLEVYTPHHKRLIKAIANITTPIYKVGNLSNGEAFYKLCS